MTKQEYQEYESKVETFFANWRIKPGLFSPSNENGETHFSKQACACCGDEKHGNREDYSFCCLADCVVLPICGNCVYYLNYGKLDDQTMMEIEESQN